MATTEATEKRVPAYLPYKTLKNFLRVHSQVVPPRFEKRMFNSMSGSVQVQLVQTLKTLELMDENWVPTDKLRKLALAVSDEAKYRDQLRAVLMSAYPFLSHFDVKTSTLGLLQEELQKMGASGGTVAKCVAFFIPAVKDAGFEVSPYIEKPGKRAPVANGRPKRSRSSAPKDLTPPPPLVTPQAVSAVTQALLDKYPTFNPDWTPEVQEKWFDGFTRLQAALEGKK